MSLANLEDDALSEDDLYKMLGPDIHIIKYPDLRNYQNIAQVLDKKGRCIILFVTNENRTTVSGHWICLLTHAPNIIEYFDSYGNAPDFPFNWLNDEQEKRLGQTKKELTRLLQHAKNQGYEIIFNTRDFQKKSNDIATCGRHVVTRLLFGFMRLPKYAKMIDESGLDADNFVTFLTEELRRKNLKSRTIHNK